jgi:hypothetical protein
MLITANMKLEQFEHLFTAAVIPAPNMLDIYFQAMPDAANEDPEQEEGNLDFEEEGGLHEEDEENDGDLEY